MNGPFYFTQSKDENWNAWALRLSVRQTSTTPFLNALHYLATIKTYTAFLEVPGPLLASCTDSINYGAAANATYDVPQSRRHSRRLE